MDLEFQIPLQVLGVDWDRKTNPGKYLKSIH